MSMDQGISVGKRLCATGKTPYPREKPVDVRAFWEGVRQAVRNDGRYYYSDVTTVTDKSGNIWVQLLTDWPTGECQRESVEAIIQASTGHNLGIYASYIYFIQALDRFNQPVKIGVSGNAVKRLSELRIGGGDWLLPIGTIVITTASVFTCEAALHRLFQKRRIYGEWFDDAGGIYAWLLKHKALIGESDAALVQQLRKLGHAGRAKLPIEYASADQFIDERDAEWVDKAADRIREAENPVQLRMEAA